MRKITGIIVHATATQPDWREGQKTETKVREVRRWHVDINGWNDIGYHFLIDRDGTTVPGRPIEQTGAHVKGHNTGTIGIALFGGHGSNATDRFEQHYTPEQDAALRRLIADLRAQFGPVPVTGHNQYAAKACPGFHAPTWFKGKARAAATSPTTAAAGLGLAGVGTTGGAILGGLDGDAQTIAVVALAVGVAAFAFVFRKELAEFVRRALS